MSRISFQTDIFKWIYLTLFALAQHESVIIISKNENHNQAFIYALQSQLFNDWS